MSELIATLITLTAKVDDETPDETVAGIVKQLLPLLRHRRVSFSDLEVDPLTLDAKHWTLETDTVRKAVRSLEALGSILSPHLFRGEASPLRPVVISYVRELWEYIVLWLDYLHPMHHVRTPRMDHSPLPVIGCVLYGLYKAKTHIGDLFRQSPRMHQLLFDLWVKMDVYCNYPFDLLLCDKLFLVLMSVRPALLSDGSRHPPPGEFISLDPIARDAAFSITGHRPRRFYRRAFHLLDLMTEAMPPVAPGGSESDSRFGSGALNQTSLLAAMCNALLITSSYARDVVGLMVDILRRLVEKHAWESAGCAAQLLWGVWRSASDRRSLLWALNDGAFELISVVAKKRDTPAIRETLQWVVQQGTCVKVMRILLARNCDIKSAALFAAQDIQLRCDVFRAVYLDRKCANKKCTTTSRSTHRCACLITYYCSPDCQRRHWPEHRPRCRSIRILSYDALVGEVHPHISRLDARYQAALTRAHIRAHGQTIIAEFRRVARSVPRPRDCALASTLVPIAPQHSYFVMNARRGQPRVSVTAEVPGVGHTTKTSPFTIVVALVPLQWILDGYLPTADGWVDAKGEWKSDEWEG